MFGLEDRHLNFIKETLKKYIPNSNAKFYIFGSRAKGTYKEYSDVDIAIDSSDLTSDIKSKLELEFENSTFPYEVDIVDLNNIKENFKNLIQDDLVLLQWLNYFVNKDIQEVITI